MPKDDPIGFFDSGVGGTSIWKAVISLLPLESTIYLADGKNAPYGEKSHDRIVELSVKNTERLINMGCKMIVVACNTATTNAISHLRQNYKIPFVGIEPAIKPAALASKSKAVGILATKGTLSSALFAKTSSLYTQDIKVVEVEGNGLVELIEAGKINSPEMLRLLKHYLAPMIKEQIDYLVLGCSHYPYLTPLLKSILPDHVELIDSGEAVARQTQNLLKKHELCAYAKKEPVHKLYANNTTKVLQDLIKDIPVLTQIAFLDF